MLLKKEKWKVFIVFAVILLIITFLASYFLLPKEISVIEGRKYQLNFHNPMSATIIADPGNTSDSQGKSDRKL